MKHGGGGPKGSKNKPHPVEGVPKGNGKNTRAHPDSEEECCDRETTVYCDDDALDQHVQRQDLVKGVDICVVTLSRWKPLQSTQHVYLHWLLKSPNLPPWLQPLFFSGPTRPTSEYFWPTPCP